MEVLMLQATEPKPIASARTPEALDFADRLTLVAKEVHLIELAVNGAEDARVDHQCIVFALRKLAADIEELADMVLPPMSEEEKQRLDAIMKGSRQSSS
jgi:hypothetical protein